jgi:transcriptional regulator with XRE-family HTH domain
MPDFGFASEQEIRAELGARLKAQRLTKGLTQIELAERAGVGVNTLKLLEGKGKCTFENFVRIAMGLGLADELQDLFLLKPKSIAQMEQVARATRVRAPRRLGSRKARK